MTVSVNRIILGMLVAAIFAAPCAYDALSLEPSALNGAAAISAAAINFLW